MYADRRTHVRFFLAFWLFVLSGVAFLDRTNLSIAGLQISTEYGLGNQRLGWIFSAFLIGYAAFQIPAGWLATRYGPRRVLTVGVLWWGITTGLTALMPAGISHAVMMLVAIRLASAPAKPGYSSGSQSVRRPLGSASGARPDQRIDFCGRRSWKRGDSAIAHLADYRAGMARCFLVQRHHRNYRRSSMVVQCTRHA